MSGKDLKQFQEEVSELVIRHRSLLDILSKYHQASSSVHRSVAKAITECGCIELAAKKQNYMENMSKDQAIELLETHVKGNPCEQCKEVISAELGSNLFYMSALCNLLDINLDEVVSNESNKCSTLGFFNMS